MVGSSRPHIQGPRSFLPCAISPPLVILPCRAAPSPDLSFLPWCFQVEAQLPLWIEQFLSQPRKDGVGSLFLQREELQDQLQEMEHRILAKISEDQQMSAQDARASVRVALQQGGVMAVTEEVRGSPLDSSQGQPSWLVGRDVNVSHLHVTTASACIRVVFAGTDAWLRQPSCALVYTQASVCLCVQIHVHG